MANEEKRADAPRSRFAPPSLPKGGGAIGGIGEKLSPNLVTGTGTLTVPLAVSAGRPGCAPELSLSYDSSGGNGPFGIGWKLPIPSVTRRTDHGMPRYRDAEGSDTFILSGAEDLVAVGATTDGNERVVRYRPRIEGLFSRIERRTNTVTGVTYWRATSRSNVVSTFGASAPARVADPRDPSRVFTWLLEYTVDDRGNIVRYVYKEEDDVAVPRTMSEANRVDGSATAGRYIKAIFYGNREAASDPAAASYCFQVLFDYGEHGASDPTQEKPTDDSSWPTPAELRPWSYRQDPFSTFRAGFEVRTRRLCRRVLTFHRFDELLDGNWVLVRSTDFAHDPTPVATYLGSIAHTGWQRADAKAGTPADRRTLPRLEMTYAKPVLDTQIREIDPASLEGVVGGVDGARQEWVDLDGEGIPGLVFREAGGTWWYKRNLGGAALAPPEPLPTHPSLGGLGAPRLVDVDGSGRKDLFVAGPRGTGFFQRTPDFDWMPFASLPSAPNLDWASRNLRQLDLDGDGIADVLLNEDDVVIAYRSLGRDGYAPPERVHKSTDERKAPALVLVEETETIFLADMTGDGLTDIVRIRNGEVCYWPNLGYGRFGAKVAMANAPAFDRPEAFDPARIRLGDIDGSGTTDVVYLGTGGAVAYFNQAGNGWSDAAPLDGFPAPTKLDTVELLDLLGIGTSCLVCSTTSPQRARTAIRYLDLMGGLKPHLLVGLDNHLGRTVTLTYASSTSFYLGDRRAGRPWITRIPFPVHVVVRREDVDAIARTRLVTRFAYHHGDYDGYNREFRGFGLVEQWDAESFGVGDPTPQSFDQPPVLTRSWFHTGVFPNGTSILRHLAHEYFPGDPVALADTVIPDPLGVDDAREACRALKGKPLRVEVYAADDPSPAPVPYTVREHAYALVPYLHAAPGQYGVWLANERETIEIHYERNVGDPRITHRLVLAVDPLGNVTDEASAAYGRRQNAVGAQADRTVTYQHHDVANVDTPTAWHVGVPVRTESFEVLGLPGLPTDVLTVDALAQSLAAPTAGRKNAVAIDVDATVSAPTLRELARSRILYWNDALTMALPEGDPGTRALLYETDMKALSNGQAARAYGASFDTTLLASECLLVDVDADGGQWAPSAVASYDAAKFYQPAQEKNPFGGVTSVDRDAYGMQVLATTDPVGNITRAQHDYRVLQPSLVTDPNANQSAARYDALGMLVTMALMGKGEGNTLAAPTLAFEYDLDQWDLAKKPARVYGRAAETYGANPTYQESYVYADGSGRQAMKKTRAEPGPAPQLDANGKVVLDANGNPVMVTVTDRWVGSGRTVFNNKGNAVKKFEPFFSVTSAYEDEPSLVEWGVTPIMTYDPLGRLKQTDYPDQTLSQVAFDAWDEVHSDQNDTVLQSGWLAQATAPGADPALQRAAQYAKLQAKTPTVRRLDALGRTIAIVVDLGGGKTLVTTQTLDAAGNLRAVIDPRGLSTTQRFDLQKRSIQTVSPDAGTRASLLDAGGSRRRAFGQRGYTILHGYDVARRPVSVSVLYDGVTQPELVEKTLWGEALDPSATNSDGATNAAPLNLRGRMYEQYDAAGLLAYERYDLKGNLLRSTRKLATTYQTTPDWSLIDGDLTLAQINAAIAGSGLLGDEVFETETDYDALDRSMRVRTHDKSERIFTYDVSSLLSKVDARLLGSSTVTPFVTQLTYNARGQRLTCAHANGATTTYVYDPNTFRLTHLTTTRPSGPAVQDLAFWYDPVGNVMEVDDLPSWQQYFGSAPISGTRQYTYDASYRLATASGREQGINGVVPPPDGVDPASFAIPAPNDTTKVRLYTETYTYDDSGNLTDLQHLLTNAPPPNVWTRSNPTDTASNRLTTGYAYDPHGNMTTLPGRPATGWDYADRLQHVPLVGGGDAYYAYDAGGHRVRKRIDRTAALAEERIYVGGYETYRRLVSNTIDFERTSLHVMDDKRRVALVESTTTQSGAPVTPPDTRYRYQLTDHLGSTTLELDETGALVSYEEYYPYGGSAYLAGANLVQASPRRYRYNGKERDDESGFYYFGARFYVPWLAKWASADPAGMVDGANLYAYVRDNPVRLSDPGGTQSEGDDDVKPKVIDADKAVTIHELARGLLLHRLEYAERTSGLSGQIGSWLRNKIRGEMQFRNARLGVIVGLLEAAPHLAFGEYKEAAASFITAAGPAATLSGFQYLRTLVKHAMGAGARYAAGGGNPAASRESVTKAAEGFEKASGFLVIVEAMAELTWTSLTDDPKRVDKYSGTLFHGEPMFHPYANAERKASMDRTARWLGFGNAENWKAVIKERQAAGQFGKPYATIGPEYDRDVKVTPIVTPIVTPLKPNVIQLGPVIVHGHIPHQPHHAAHHAAPAWSVTPIEPPP